MKQHMAYFKSNKIKECIQTSHSIQSHTHHNQQCSDCKQPNVEVFGLWKEIEEG